MNYDTRRAVVGFIAAPALGVLAWAFLVAALAPDQAEALSQLPSALVFSLVYAYAAGIVLGIPAFLIYRRFRIDSFMAYALGGFLGGTLLGSFLFGFADSAESMNPRLASALLWLAVGFGGAIGAAFFWALVIKQTRYAA